MAAFHPRIIEPPLGKDTEDRPTLEEVRALWDAAVKQPVPIAEWHDNLRAFLRRPRK